MKRVLLILMFIHLSFSENIFGFDILGSFSKTIKKISDVSSSTVLLKENSSFIKENKLSLSIKIEEPDNNFTIDQMILSRGYLYEKHYVITQDCYILTMFRIINPNFQTKELPPILLQHGLMESSLSFIYGSSGGRIDDLDDKNLACALSKKGYDVWLGNFRGNTFSKNHTTLKNTNPLFWKFSLDNHAPQDLPAELAYIQKHTKFDQVGYIGYSQGTMTMFELLALKPDIAKVVKPYIALAPVSYLTNTKTVLKYLAYSKIILSTLSKIYSPLFQDSDLNNAFSEATCNGLPVYICKGILELATGFGENVNKSRIQVYFNNIPAGTSVTNIVHFGQNIKSGKFQMFDYYLNNKVCYGTTQPPEIPLDKIINENMYLLSSENDIFADPEDVKKLYDSLKVKFQKKVVDKKKFSHIDFIYAETSDVYVNNHILEFLKTNKPSKKVSSSKKLILKNYDEHLCTTMKKEDVCNINLVKLVIAESK